MLCLTNQIVWYVELYDMKLLKFIVIRIDSISNR